MGVRKVREAKDSMETPDVSKGKEPDRGKAGRGQALGERLRLEGPHSILCRQAGDSSASPMSPDLDLAMGDSCEPPPPQCPQLSAQQRAQPSAGRRKPAPCMLLNQSVQPHWAPHRLVKQKTLPYSHTHGALPPQKNTQWPPKRASCILA